MFAPPPRIEADVFVKMPEKIGITGRFSYWASIQFGGADTPTFLEGPSFDRAGNLWVVDIPWGRLLKITPAGEVSVGCEYDGEPNGLKFHKDGRAFVCDHKQGIMVFDPASGKIEPFLERNTLERFKATNDLVFTRNGDMYFTDQGQTSLADPTGRLYRLRADTGKLECLLDNVPGPNGLVLNKAENVLFLAVTRANAVWKITLLDNGDVAKVSTYIQMTGGTGPDGMAIDENDNLAVCHVGFGAVWLFSHRGEPMLRIDAPVVDGVFGHMTTNCAYGGPDNKTLFITESKTGTVLSAPMPVAGRKMYSHQD
ncbi:MAG: SMP-30/gluconolactonase/LRE family protein [Novosphingobium sp.]